MQTYQVLWYFYTHRRIYKFKIHFTLVFLDICYNQVELSQTFFIFMFGQKLHIIKTYTNDENRLTQHRMDIGLKFHVY